MLNGAIREEELAEMEGNLALLKQHAMPYEEYAKDIARARAIMNACPHGGGSWSDCFYFTCSTCGAQLVATNRATHRQKFEALGLKSAYLVLFARTQTVDEAEIMAAQALLAKPIDGLGDSVRFLARAGDDGAGARGFWVYAM